MRSLSILSALRPFSDKVLGMGGSQILLVWLLLALFGAVATLWWSRRLWQRRSTLSVGMKAAAAAATVSAVTGAFGTVVGLVKVFGAIGGESEDPSQRARILAEGISTSLNSTVLALVIWLPSVITLTMLLRNSKTSSV